ncbi:MAG: gliding motility-associated C-terminal domain-containing protein [Aureispira sp.]
MRRIFTHSPLCQLLVLVLSLVVSQQLVAQTANQQRVTTECYTGPTRTVGRTPGTLITPVTFQQGNGSGQIPVGHVITDVIVEIQWSKTDDGSCGANSGLITDLEDVGFTIFNNTLGARFLAASNNTGGSAFPPTTSTFSGTFPANSTGIVQATTYFRDGFNRAYPYAPTSGDTISPNNDPLSAYRGTNPIGNWQIGLINDAVAPSLCVHSYCITLVTCAPAALTASCQAFPEVALDPTTGLHAFTFADLDSLSDVSCLANSITFSPRTVNCSNVGTVVPVTMRIQDNLGTVDSCVSAVAIRDTSPPTIPYCSQPGGTPFATLYLNSSGLDTFFASSVPMNDNCGPIIKEVRNLQFNSPWRSSIDFSCVVGQRQFWVRGRDAAGNVDSCIFIVDIIDTIPPTAVCGSDTLYVGNGAQILSPINIDGGSNDFCPNFPIGGRWIGSVGATNPTYTCADLGQFNVTLYVSDSRGNIDSCTNAMVTVLDTTTPTVICQNVTVYLSSTGSATLNIAQVDNGSFDSCGIVSQTINGGATINYACADVGTPQNVVLRLEDPSGNADSCTAIITVLDTFPPTAICQNASIFVNGAGVATVNASSLNNNSVDVCSGNNLLFTINGNATANFDCDDIATSPNAVTLTVADTNGNSSTCTANVTVLDTLDPTVSCTSPTVYLDTNGLVTVTTAELTASSNDNCIVIDSSINVVGITSINYNCSAIFTPQVAQLIIRDTSINRASCTATITVVDTVTPIAACNTTFTAQLDASGSATVTPLNLDSASTDNCGIVSYLINNQPNQTYSCADIGTLSAVLTVVDSSRNQATCRTNVVVVDNTPPTASCRISDAYLSASGTVAIVPNNVLAFPATNDNCSNVTTSFAGGNNTIIYNCDSLGMRTVNVIVTDGSNNTATCQTTVTVKDTFAPTANCRTVPYTVQLDTNGNGFVVPADIDNNSSDICGLDTLLVNGVDSFFYDCTNVGPTAVTLFVVDNANNQSTCVANIIVADNIPPVAVCQDTTFYLGTSGVVTVFPTAIDAASTDNCSFTRRINNLPSVTYDCMQVGTNTAQLLITDGNGNTDQCSAQITIIDTISPTANCVAPSSVTVFLDSTCVGIIDASILNNNSQDNCSTTLNYTVGGSSRPIFTAANLTTNPNQVILEVCDGSNNCSTCMTSVIVADNIPPTMVCRPDTVQLDGNGNAVVIPNNVNGGSRDNCSVPSYTINGAPVINFDCTNLGSNNVTLVGTDQSGNSDSCMTTVFVEDITAPNASCNGTITVVLDPLTSLGTLTVAQVDNSSSDNCQITNFNLSRTSFNCNDIPNNPHTITMVVVDQSGNTDSCTTLVTVEDNVAPTALCRTTPLNLSLVGSTVSTTVAAINNGSNDNCALASLTLNQTIFSCADVGSNTITLTATDSSGNTASCNATVVVSDVTNPTPFCVNPTVQLDTNGVVGVAATDLNTGSFDNCLIDTVLVGGVDSVFFSCADLGINTVTVFMSDPSTNSATCPSTITVEDNIDPIALCVGTPIQLQLDANGVGNITPAQVNNNSTDNCTINNLVLSRSTFNCADVGSNTPVILTVIDQSGNSDNCSANVMVMDTVRPNMACQPVTVNVHLALGGTAPITANLFDAGTNDSCGIATLSFRGAPTFVTCTDIGTRPITLIATDVNGNIDSCTTTLTVLDTIAPTLVCDTITINLDNMGVATIDSATTGLYTVNDACGVVSVTLNGGTNLTYNCVDTGFNTINLVAIDNSNNSAGCIAGVNIQDVTPPLVTCRNSTQFLDSTGALAIDPNWIIGAPIVEACGVDTIFTTPSTFDCTNVGSFNTVTLTVVDNSGNQSSCSGSIDVRDTVPPTMVCRDTTICLSGGFVNVTPADIDGGTFDACGLSGIQTINGSNNAIFTCADLGVQVVVLEREDANGNKNTCQANVTVQDCTPPSAICRGTFTAQVGANGFATVRAIALDFGSNDDCGIDSTSFRVNGRDSILYSCNAINTPDTVLFTVADLAGNLDSCTAIITIQDLIPPVARCGGPINAVLSANNGEFIVPAINLNNTSNSSTDNCTIATFLINGQARDTFDCSMVGANTAILTVIDQSNNSDTCQAIVNVRDITSPTLNCRFTTNLTLDINGQAILPVANIVLTANDNCGISTILSSGVDTLVFTCDSIGSNAIIVEVTDSSGNTARCNAIVNVQDNISPTAICPTLPVPVYLNSAGSIWVTAQQIDSASFDNCSIIDYQINLTDSVQYNCSQIGQFPAATLTVVDSTGNSDVCPVTIEVIDTIAPVALCRSGIVVDLNLVGQVFVAANRIDSGSTDNCTNISRLINGFPSDTFDCSNVGAPVNVVLTVIDQYNNSSFCTTTVTVVDITPPTIQCLPGPIDFYLNNNGTVTVTPQQVANAFDTCAIASWTINGQPSVTFDCSNIGTNQLVTVRVADQSGNSVQCNTILNIRDTIAPTQGCSNITVALDSMGTAVVCGADLMSFNMDNCAIVDTLINGQSCVTYGCNDIAQSPLTATLTLIDASNNTTTCTSVITLIDNIAPVLDCDSLVVVQLDPTGVATVGPGRIINTFIDQCNTPNFTLTQTTFSCSDVGNNNTVVLTATDASGNSSTCSSVIQVEDNTPPVAICRNYDVYLNSTGGTATLVADSIDNGSYDSCGIASILFNTGSSTMNFNCADTGAIMVTIIVTDFYGNLDSCSATVTVRDTSAPALICRSINIDLTNTGQDTLTPVDVLNNSFDNCFIDTTFVTPNLITCTDIGSFVYTVTAIDASGNVGICQDTVNVTLASPIVLIPTQDTVLCEGSTFPLSARAPSNGIAYDYQWSGPNGAITQNPITTDTTINNITVADQGWYIFTINRRNGSGCPASDSIFLTVNDVPAPVLTGTPPCEGDTGIVYLSNVAAYTGTNIAYNWYFNGVALANTGDSLIIPNMTAADSGSYSMQIQVTQGAAICSDSSALGFDYDVLDLPAVPVPTATTPCEGQTLTLLNNAPGNNYAWSGPAGFSSTQAIPTRTNTTLAFAGLYTLTVTDANGCSNDGSVTVVIRPTPPNPTIMYTQPLCNGDLLELQDTTTYPVPPVIYYWAGPNNTFDTTAIGQLMLAGADSGLYQLRVAMNGCFSEQPDSVNVQYEPLPMGLDDFFSIQFRDSLVGGDIIVNDAPNPAGYSLAIIDSTNGGQASLDVTAGTLNYTPRSGFFGVDTLYYALCDAQCPNSCDTVEVLIEVVTEFECYIPQGLSPNGDGINDQLIVRCKNNYPNAEIKIFSRWGTLVYQGEPTGWNGQFNGKDLPDGTYFYVLNLNDTTYTGTGTNKAEGRVGDRYSGYIMLQR